MRVPSSSRMGHRSQIVVGIAVGIWTAEVKLTVVRALWGRAGDLDLVGELGAGSVGGRRLARRVGARENPMSWSMAQLAGGSTAKGSGARNHGLGGGAVEASYKVLSMNDPAFGRFNASAMTSHDAVSTLSAPPTVRPKKGKLTASAPGCFVGRPH